jgi:hypothetical protein
LIYKSNPKHKEPWQRGRKGALCPSKFPRGKATQLLDSSVLIGDKRYASYEGMAYCAQSDDNDNWHGYPIGWCEVPEKIRNSWLKEQSITKKQIRANW